MKNIRMLLLVLAPLTIITHVPVSVHAMASDSSKPAEVFKRIEVLCHQAFGDQNEGKRRFAVKQLLELLLEPWDGWEWCISNERKQQELELATLIKKSHIIGHMVTYSFVNESILTRLIRYIQKKFPHDLQGIINHALLSAASVGNFMLMRDLITNYGVDINFQQDGFTIHKLLLEKDRRENLRNNEDFRYILVRVIPDYVFNSYITELFTNGMYEGVFELMRDFVAVRFDSEFMAIFNLSRIVYHLLIEKNPEKAKLFPQMFSVEQFIKIIQVYLDERDYQMVFFLLKDLAASGSIATLTRVMQLLGNSPVYNSNCLLRHYIQKIINMSREGAEYKDIAPLSQEFLAAEQHQREEEQRQRDEEFERQQQAFIREQKAENRERQGQIDSLFIAFTDQKKLSDDKKVKQVYALLYTTVMENKMMSVCKYLKKYASSKPDLVRRVFQYQGDDGRTLLHLLAMKSYNKKLEECWNILFSLGFDINIQDGMGNTLLHSAAMFKNNELYAQLITWVANPSIRNQAGQTPLDIVRFTKGKKR